MTCIIGDGDWLRTMSYGSIKIILIGGPGKGLGHDGKDRSLSGKSCSKGLYGIFCQECPSGTFKNVSGSDKARCLECPSSELPHRAKYVAVRGCWILVLVLVQQCEPSQSMQRAGQSLIKDLKNLPLIQSYNSIQALTKSINKVDREHDLVIASYVLGEIPSLKDRITVVRQLWDLTRDVLVLVEPGTPHGANIISQMRSHILWKEKRRSRKLENSSTEASKDFMTLRSDAHIVAPCPHDGTCPLDKTGKYCHFVQRLERTTSQRAYKRSKGEPLRGFEDEKFCFVAFRRGQRPRESWPLDGVKFDTLKEQHAKRQPKDFEIDFDDQLEPEDEIVREEDPATCDSDITNNGDEDENEDEEVNNDRDISRADLGGGWGKIIYSPVRRGKLVEMDVCRAINRDSSEGAFERIVVTQSKNPTLHKQAKGAQWGDLWQ